jgi:hypothetical protein
LCHIWLDCYSYNPLNRFNLLYVFLVQFPLVGVFETIVYPLRLAADPNSMCVGSSELILSSN